MIGQQILQPRFRCGRIYGSVMGQAPDIHAHGYIVLIVLIDHCRLRLRIGRGSNQASIAKLSLIRHAVQPHDRIPIALRQRHHYLHGDGRLPAGLGGHALENRNLEHETIVQRACRFVKFFDFLPLRSRGQDILHVLMAVNGISAIRIHIELLQI